MNRDVLRDASDGAGGLSRHFSLASGFQLAAGERRPHNGQTAEAVKHPACLPCRNSRAPAAKRLQLL